MYQEMHIRHDQRHVGGVDIYHVESFKSVQECTSVCHSVCVCFIINGGKLSSRVHSCSGFAQLSQLLRELTPQIRLSRHTAIVKGIEECFLYMTPSHTSYTRWYVVCVGLYIYGRALSHHDSFSIHCHLNIHWQAYIVPTHTQQYAIM